MLRSMYSGISGLKAQQTKLDVIGNNIANANTTAFKSQNIRFKDMLSQNMSEATGPQRNIGGTNPRQIGLGVQVGGIFTDTTTGNMQTTGRNLDVAIDGAGYFIVGRGGLSDDPSDMIGIKSADHTVDETKGSTVQTSFTRDGSFILDEQGSILTSDGLRVYGYQNENAKITYGDITVKPVKQNSIEITDKESKFSSDTLQPLTIPDEVSSGGKNVRVQSFTIEQNGVIKATLADGSNVDIGQIAMASFKNPGGLTKTGKNLYTSSANSGEPIVRSQKGADAINDNSKGYGDALQGKTEMSNVDLAEQFTEMIVANRAFQACGKMITTGDEILQDLVNLKR